VRTDGGTVSLYLDTSCLLKLFFAEPESAQVAAIVARERQVVVTSLARLEALVQLSARAHARLLSRRAAAGLAARIDAVLRLAPYELVPTPPAAENAAEAQLQPLGRRAHCRTLDRLHLGAMQKLGLGRLLTNDQAQATAAKDLGFEVLVPH
jgi:predicted nucleic acid-binding protein